MLDLLEWQTLEHPGQISRVYFLLCYSYHKLLNNGLGAQASSRFKRQHGSVALGHPSAPGNFNSITWLNGLSGCAYIEGRQLVPISVELCVIEGYELICAVASQRCRKGPEAC
jgi:hypothetical protein